MESPGEIIAKLSRKPDGDMRLVIEYIGTSAEAVPLIETTGLIIDDGSVMGVAEAAFRDGPADTVLDKASPLSALVKALNTTADFMQDGR